MTSLKQKEVSLKEQELEAEIKILADAEKYAAEVQAEVDKTRAVKAAEAEAQARIARAEAEKEANIKEAEGIRAKLQAEATNVDRYAGNNDGAINKKEFKKLEQLLNGNQELKAELENETDDIKKVFGYEGSVKASKTEAPKAEKKADDKKVDTKANEKENAEAVKNAYYSYRGIDPITRKPLTDEAGNPYTATMYVNLTK